MKKIQSMASDDYTNEMTYKIKDDAFGYLMCALALPSFFIIIGLFILFISSVV